MRCQLCTKCSRRPNFLSSMPAEVGRITDPDQGSESFVGLNTRPTQNSEHPGKKTKVFQHHKLLDVAAAKGRCLAISDSWPINGFYLRLKMLLLRIARTMRATITDMHDQPRSHNLLLMISPLNVAPKHGLARGIRFSKLLRLRRENKQLTL